MEQVKLVIWDLDDTFWKGVLSDGAVTEIPKHTALVKELTDRGIVNSICSKNDYEKAKARLVEMGVWDYFVFASIDWSPKGARIGQMISAMNLRPVNALFVDDNPHNLQEAAFAVPGLQTAAPEQLPTLINDAALRGKDDAEHTRLKQYRVLETKAAAKERSASNEEFLYQSDIRVDMREDCSGLLERIYEMIHRNNQLNFTKDRISQEEVNALFTDPAVRSGVVHVRDRYGDHGIVGCYAVRGKRAEQLVFSCRILGMGVEQYVYAKLGFPDIDVVGEVAAQLDKTTVPCWIHAEDDASFNKDITPPRHLENSGASPRLIVYGTCPLRPVWGYLEQKLNNASFMETNLTIPTSNLGVLLRESPQTLEFLLKNVSVLDANASFPPEIKRGDMDYLLFTLTNEMDHLYRYEDKGSALHFYAPLIDAQNATSDILERFARTPITLEHIEEELTYVCAHLPSNVTILLQTVSEVIFLERGKDNNYYNRLELNKLAERLADKFPRVKLIDIRKYAKYASDFWEPVANHYNRAIGYSVAQEILRVMGIGDSSTPSGTATLPAKRIPANAIQAKATVGDEKIDYRLYLQNGQLRFLATSENPELQFSGKVYKDRYQVAELPLENGTESMMNVDKPGAWRIAVEVFQRHHKLGEFKTNPIRYTPMNYFQYTDADAEYYDTYKNSANHFINDNTAANRNCFSLLRDLSALAANGRNLAEFFLAQGIEEISVFFDDVNLCKCVMAYLSRSRLKVKYIFTTGELYSLMSDDNMSTEVVRGVDTIPLGPKDCLLFQGSAMSTLYWKFVKTRARRFYLTDVISQLYTQQFFMERLPVFLKDSRPLLLAVKVPSMLRSYFGFPRKAYRPNERAAFSSARNADYALKHLEGAYDKFPAQFHAIGKEQLSETLQRPTYYVPAGTLANRMKDTSGKYLNIRDGFRVTCGQPDSYVGNIYLFGGGKVFGYGSSDEETIASCLQSVINLPFKVRNCSNYTSISSMFMALRLMKEMEFHRNDVIVLFIDNYVSDWEWPIYWMNWNAISEPVVKVDAYPLFLKAERPDYFLLPEGYTPAGNRAIAELIRDAIYQNIRLF